MVERVVLRRRAQLRRLPQLTTVVLQASVAREALPLRPRRLRLPTASERTRHQESRARRDNRYDTVHALLARGLSQRHIARLLGISRTTVHKFVHADQFPERATELVTASNLDPYLSYLHQRWQEGCHNSQQLWREIQAQGFPNGPRQIMRWAHQRRTEPAPSTPRAYRHTPTQGPFTDQSAASQQVVVPLGLGSPREVVRLLLRDRETLTSPEQRLLTYVLQDTHIGTMYVLVQQFQQMIRQREPTLLDPWLAAAATSHVPDLHAFAVNIQRDYEAVRAALQEEWSSGQIEGQITRVKLIKRRMYGRANFDLLRQHVLCGD
jgi:transposase